MKVIGFTKEGYERYKQGIESNAIEPSNHLWGVQSVIDTILEEGSAQYYGDDGAMVYFDKYDLAEIYR